MIYLLITSLIWAFSFGIIKNQLSGMDPILVGFLRLFISLMIFTPFLSLTKLKSTKTSNRLTLHLLTIGAIQFGLMYASYIYSFQYLKAHEVALFTVLTPIYVVLINDLINKKGIDPRSMISALFAVIGAGVIVYKRMGDNMFITGILLVQISNICFAAGQIYYKNIMKKVPNVDHSEIFAIPYLGGALITLLLSLVTVHWSAVEISTKQAVSIIYLGLVASGLCFFLWNKGATLVSASTLAVMNNIKIPLAVLCSIIIFGESASWAKLIIGGGIMTASVFISNKKR